MKYGQELNVIRHHHLDTSGIPVAILLCLPQQMSQGD